MTHGTTPMTPATLMGLSISLATGLYGLSFGALAVAAGLTVTQTVVLSAVMFTGGSQFAFVGVIATGGSPAAAVGAATMLYLRNAIYGAQMAVLLSPRGPWKFLAAHITIDESAGTASIQDTSSERHRGFWVAGIGVFLLWNLFTLAGALWGHSATPKPSGWMVQQSQLSSRSCGHDSPNVRCAQWPTSQHWELSSPSLTSPAECHYSWQPPSQEPWGGEPPT